MLRSLRTSLWVVAISLALYEGSIVPALPQGDVPVEMAPFRVSAGAYSVNCEHAVESGRIVAARVSWVSPEFRRLGLQVGDSVESVDGVKVSSMTIDEYAAAAARPQQPGYVQKVVFIGKRGLFRKSKRLVIEVTSPRPKK
jgi:hypothetical protein